MVVVITAVQATTVTVVTASTAPHLQDVAEGLIQSEPVARDVSPSATPAPDSVMNAVVV